MKKPATQTKPRAGKDGMQRILSAAVDEFCRAGLAGAKLEVIALQAGVSKQLIHHYFRTKAALYVAVIDEITTQEIDVLINLDYESCKPDEAIALFLHCVSGFFIHWPFLAGLYNDQSLYGGEHMPECRELINRSPELMDRLEAVLRRGQNEGIFRKDIDFKQSIAAALMVVMGGFTNGPLLSSLVPIDFTKDENIERWRQFSVQFVLNSLKQNYTKNGTAIGVTVN